MAYTEFYCRTTGSNLNAGSENADAARLTYASGNWVAATGVFTVASGNPVNDGVVVGDFASVYPDGSSVGVFIGRVTARNATTITVDLTAKSGTAPTNGTGNRTLKIGGAFKGPNAAENFPFGFIQSTLTNSSGHYPRINFKNGTNYSITAAITHANAGPIRWEGMTTTPGDGGRATIDGGTGGASYVPLTISGNGNSLINIIIGNNGATGSATGLVVSGACDVRRCVVHDVRGIGILSQTTSSVFVACETYLCNQSNTANCAGFNCEVTGTVYIRCIAHDNAGGNTNGFRLNTTCICISCIGDTNGANGFAIPATGLIELINCDCYNNAVDGIRLSNASRSVFIIENCNLLNNRGWGINGSGAGERLGVVHNCGFGAGTQDNDSGTTTGLSAIEEAGSITYANDITPWVDPANGDFRINRATAIGTGYGIFTQTASSYTGTVGYPSVGASAPAPVMVQPIR